jgi:methionyl-tRNA formyltransferase
LRLLFAGTPAAALPSLTAVAESPRHELVAVLTRPDARSGRGRRVCRSPVAQWAQERDVRVLQPPRPADPGFLATLRELDPDCCPVVAYGALLPQAALDVPAHGWVNLHFSLLPAWRGAAPVQHALIAGDEVTGATAFRLEAGLDIGPVYGVLTEKIRVDDTAGSLLERLATAGAPLLVAALDGIEDGALEPRPQSADGVSLAPKLTVEQARVDWSRPAVAVDRLVRGCTPEPGAWTTWRGERLKLGPVVPGPRPVPEPAGHNLPPGVLRVTRRDVQVGTGTTEVTLTRLQPSGRAPMAAADWARGARPEPTDRFE